MVKSPQSLISLNYLNTSVAYYVHWLGLQQHSVPR